MSTQHSSAVLSPAHVYLAGLDPSQQDVAFLSFNTGFLPPKPLPSLPPPYDAWAKAAAMLPSLCKSSDWPILLTAIPQLSATHLPSTHLLHANVCLAAIAHALTHIGCLPVPSTIIDPWMQISHRLGNSVPSFTQLDVLYYNFDFISAHFPPSVPLETQFITDPWAQTVRKVMLTGTLTESHFLTSAFSVEAAARPLPLIMSTAHNAVLQQDNNELKRQLVHLTDIIAKMTSAFVSSDCRPMSPRYVDHVEFNRCVGAVANPVVPGEKSGSGLLNPSFHLLDAFFARKTYDTELGVMSRAERDWFPKLYRDFFEQIEKVNVFQYITSIQDNAAREDLVNAFRRALYMYAGDSGLLGKHRIRVSGFIEVATKVGRTVTTSGSSTPNWRLRPWVKINDILSEAMKERLRMCEENFFLGTVKSCQSAEKSEATNLVIDTRGVLTYKPGDRILILSQNSDELVQETLDVFKMSADDTITVTEPVWISALKDRHIEYSQNTEDGSVQINAEIFFRNATLQPLNSDLGLRIAESMFVINPALFGFLVEERACNVPIALSIVEKMTNISPKHLISQLDSIFHPLLPYIYSITSNLTNAPQSVEIVIGKVQYEAITKLSFKHRFPLSRSSYLSDELSTLPDSCSYLKRYIPKSDGSEANESKSETNTPDIRPSKKESKNSRHRNHESEQSAGEAAVVKIIQLLADRKKQTTSCLTAMAIFRSQVICNITSNIGNQRRILSGVSSQFLSHRKPGDKVLLRVEPELDFHLPDDPETPIIMFALGSGLAPFRSYLKELINNKSRDGYKRRKAWLVIGVKSQHHIPYLEEIEEAVCKEKVVELSVACSQEDVEFDLGASKEHLVFRPGTRKRIQGLFEESYELHHKLWEMIAVDAHVYACGRPELEPMVRSVIANAVKRFATHLWNLSYFDSVYKIDSLATEYADRMAAEKRLHIDAYYSGKPAVMKDAFTAAQIAEHRSASSCWVIFRGSVYDITRYIAVHPGGPKLLLDKGGRDMTVDFNVSHGADNLRVMSMVEPYKIGYLETFPKASNRIKSFMNEWSVPLLYEALELKSVFMLDWNEFPELNEPTSFVEYKSYIMSPSGIKGLCERVRSRHEPEMFALMEKYLGDETLWKIVSFLCDGRADGQIALKELRENRNRWLAKKTWSEDDGLLKRTRQFMDEIVEVCLEMQKCVEKALEQSLRGLAYKETCALCITNLLSKFLHGVVTCYERY